MSSSFHCSFLHRRRQGITFPCLEDLKFWKSLEPPSPRRANGLVCRSSDLWWDYVALDTSAASSRIGYKLCLAGSLKGHKVE